MKRRYDQGGGWDRDSSAPKQHKAETSWDNSQSQLAMKLLFPLAEARVIQGKDDETLRLLQKLTGTQVKLSSDEELYPGTEMRELTLRGATVEAVHNAAVLALSQISSLSGSGGSVTGGEPNVEAGGARIKCILPSEVVLGADGTSIEQLCSQRGARAIVLPTVIPPGETSELREQILCLSGSLISVQGALQAVGHQVASVASSSWFEKWACGSNCGMQFPGLLLIQKGQPVRPQRSRWEEGAPVAPPPAVVVPPPAASSSKGAADEWAGPRVVPPMGYVGDFPNGCFMPTGKGKGPDMFPGMGPDMFAGMDKGMEKGTEKGMDRVFDRGMEKGMEKGKEKVLGMGMELMGLGMDMGMTMANLSMTQSMPNLGTASTDMMVMKLLIGEEEAAVLRARGGMALEDIQRVTGTEIAISREGDVYPGTSLLEMVVGGGSASAVATAIVEAMKRVVDNRGSLGLGDQQMEQGAASLKVIIPSKTTAAVIGPGGNVVAQIRSQTQMHVHVETTAVPPGPPTDISEQVVSFDGPLMGVQPAIIMITDILVPFIPEPWFKAWAGHSNSGQVIPGLVLFQDAKGKSKGKGKFKGKDGFGKAIGAGGLAMKLLLPPNEASCVMGKGGITVREIGQATGTRMSLSNRDHFYPGTQLQELVVKGSTHESVLNALAYTLQKIAELSGSVCGAEPNVEPGGCRLKVVVPSASAAAIIGPAGSVVKQIRERSHMHIHIEEAIIPPGPPTELSEQVVSLSGPLDGAYVALSMIAEAVGLFCFEPWFEAWSSHSHCGLLVPGLVLFVQGKGKTKSKGMPKGCFKGPGPMFDDFNNPPIPGLALANMDISQLSQADLAQIPPGVLATMMGRSEDGAQQAGGPSNGADGEATGAYGFAPMALKVLVSGEEVGILGRDPATMMQIQQATGTTGMLSERHYPGTSLQELTVQGPSNEAVFNAVLLILNKVAEVNGAVTSGENNVPPGDARVKLVVPKRVAAAIIGPGGQNVKQIKVQTGIHVHVDSNSIPCMEGISEQGVCLAGQLSSIHGALGHIIRELANFSCEPWFEAWAAHSNTGQVIPGLTLFEGKGKGSKGKAMDKGSKSGFGNLGP